MKAGDVVVFVHLSVFMTYEQTYVVEEPGMNQYMDGFINVISDNGTLRTFTKDAFISLSEHREKRIDLLLK